MTVLMRWLHTFLTEIVMAPIKAPLICDQQLNVHIKYVFDHKESIILIFLLHAIVIRVSGSSKSNINDIHRITC